MREPLAPPPFDPSRPFSRDQGLAAGLTLRQLRGRDYRSIFFDVYIAASVEVTTKVRACAALDLCENGHVSHFTAAELWGAWVPKDPNVHVSVRCRADRRKRRGIKFHLAHPTAAVTVHRGIPLSSPTQTFLELARYLELVDLVVLGDSLVHRGLLTPAELVHAADRWRGHCSILARRAARLVRAGVESPMETRLRLLLVLAGLPEPVVNHEVIEEGGRMRIRLDLSYPHLKLAIEYDGRQHARDTRQWRHDLARREELDRLGWRLIIVTAEGLFDDPGGTLVRTLAGLRDRGARPTVIANDEWGRHFPSRRVAA